MTDSDIAQSIRTAGLIVGILVGPPLWLIAYRLSVLIDVIRGQRG